MSVLGEMMRRDMGRRSITPVLPGPGFGTGGRRRRPRRDYVGPIPRPRHPKPGDVSAYIQETGRGPSIDSRTGGVGLPKSRGREIVSGRRRRLGDEMVAVVFGHTEPKPKGRRRR